MNSESGNTPRRFSLNIREFIRYAFARCCSSSSIPGIGTLAPVVNGACWAAGQMGLQKGCMIWPTALQGATFPIGPLRSVHCLPCSI